MDINFTKLLVHQLIFWEDLAEIKWAWLNEDPKSFSLTSNVKLAQWEMHENVTQDVPQEES